MPLVWAMILGCLAVGDDAYPRAAYVDRDHVELLDEPNDAAFSTGRLFRGQKVTIRRAGPPGWATLDPPPGSFSYIDQNDVEDEGLTVARVIVKYAAVRTGRDRAGLPGPPRSTLREGAKVKLLDRRPLVLRRPGEVRTWLAIEPPRAEVRFVREECLSDIPPVAQDEARAPRDRLVSGGVDLAPPSLRSRRPSPETQHRPRIEIDRQFVSLVKPAGDEPVSPDLAATLSRVTDAHQRILAGPMDRWDLRAVEIEYQTLLRGATGSDRRVLEERLRLVKRQTETADAMRRMETLLTRSRSRDHKVDEVQELATDPRKGKPSYDAIGLLQSTSKLVDGRQVHALLGDDGSVVAYLLVPPGLPVKPYLFQQVGVRGEGQFNESLRFKLIKVHDLEPLKSQARGQVLLSF